MEHLSENSARTAATTTATTIQPAAAVAAPDASVIATTSPKQIYIPSSV